MTPRRARQREKYSGGCRGHDRETAPKNHPKIRGYTPTVVWQILPYALLPTSPLTPFPPPLLLPPFIPLSSAFGVRPRCTTLGLHQPGVVAVRVSVCVRACVRPLGGRTREFQFDGFHRAMSDEFRTGHRVQRLGRSFILAVFPYPYLPGRLWTLAESRLQIPRKSPDGQLWVWSNQWAGRCRAGRDRPELASQVESGESLGKRVGPHVRIACCVLLARTPKIAQYGSNERLSSKLLAKLLEVARSLRPWVPVAVAMR
eukprot:scaffold142136_cov37-Tisochrysis_lutea.AAC.1